MSRFTSRMVPAWVLGGLSVLMFTQPGQADEPGFASTRSVMQQQITPANHEYCPNCPQGGYVVDGGYGYCPDGYCPGYCQDCYGPGVCYYWGQWWGTGCHMCSHKLHNMINWLHPHGIGTVSPDHGWSPPGKTPMRTVYVPYRNLYPADWTGQPHTHAGAGMAAPHIYMPTDTTQLGYYYQHAPAWTPAPAPGAPLPSYWHRHLCGPGGTMCQNGYCPEGGVIYGETCPEGVFQDGEPTPVDEQAPPPSPLPAGETADPLGPTASFLAPRVTE